MKIVQISSFFLGLILAGNAIEIENADLTNFLNLDDFKVELPQDLLNEFLLVVRNTDLRASGIVAEVNDYADKVIANIQSAFIRYGLDPMALPNTTLNLVPTGTIDLYSGWLQDISTLARNGDVEVTYSSTTRNMELVLPIKFDTLLFQYKYHTKVLLLSILGDTDGKVSDVKINVRLSLNYETYVVSLDDFDITDTGAISLKFTGNSLVDWLTNTMTSVVALFLHPLILNIIQTIVQGGLNSVVDAVNDLIKSILSPGS